MKTNLSFWLLFLSVIIVFSNCKKDDDSSEITYPVELKLKECTDPSDPTLMTYDGDIPTDLNLPLAQTAMGYFDDNKDIWLPESIILQSEDSCRLVAAAGGTLSAQSQLENITYTLTNSDFEFNLTEQQGKKIVARGDRKKITIPYRTFAKVGQLSSGGGHLPVSYESSLFTNFSPNDSLVYITYDVIYEIE